MKICYIAPLNSVHTYKWIKYFHDLGHEIHCIGNEKVNIKIDGINYYSFKDKNNILYKNSLFRLVFFTIFGIKTIKKINPDITHLHFIGFGSIIALLYKSKKLITTIWGSDILVLPKKIPLYKNLVNKILIKSDIITIDGYNTYNEVLSYGILEKKIKMIGFGIDTKIFKKIQIQKNAENPLKIISLRSLGTIYDIQTIIKAGNILKNKGQSFVIDIYGDGKEKEKLIKMTNELSLNNYINFKGSYKIENLPNYLNESDVYVSVSLSDSGLACSTGEAMACGLPVIITNNSDNLKRVENFKNGFIIDEKSPEMLAEKISYFIKNRNKIAIMGEKNISIIKERYDYYNEMSKVNTIYKTI